MKKVFICFWVGDGGDRESYSVFYSEIVEANSKEEAIEKYLKSKKLFSDGSNLKYYDAIEKEIIS